MPSIHELKRMTRGAIAKTAKCDGCDRRRKLNVEQYCADCAIDRAERLALRGMRPLHQVMVAARIIAKGKP